ncbi:acetate/propionate family kinase [Sulfurimonas paralvinellae]|uniref:Acetate kinase n=1 Tax=Sulfurimonas paralvinellae TaxID=317658 RepID=A0A7M1B661_9BACT|nr:acetate kinase [Sulfurimonas paralvinellae]QOP45217.1 acetate kinase [Sulfurimonas paralvinellae]
MKIAVINSGSSSLKFKLFAMPSKKLLQEKEIQKIGEDDSGIASHAEALDALDMDLAEIDAVGHRVVHGGEKLQKSCLIDTSVMKTIESLIPLAPLHNPANIEGIQAMKEKMPDIPQMAVFDTAFHATLPEEAFVYALPYKLYAKHEIRRYGFHGTSHSYLTKEAAKLLDKPVDEVNLITLHLGNGASACAVKNGKSIDTSMGFTPLEGLVMGTRCGDIDPDIALFLQRELGLSTKEVDTLLNKESGLKGICGENDLREILLREDERANLALKIMVRRIQKYIGSYMVLLENVDAIVFSGGIGEHSAYVREQVMQNSVIENIKSLVIETNEELEIANECYRILKNEDI